MLKIIENGNIFESKCDFLINPVNTVGVMGKGLAYNFKKKYPQNFLKYEKYCKSKDFTIGKLLIIQENNKNIINFPTKKHWKEKSEYEYILLGLEKLKIALDKYNISSIAFPKIGCGLGNLEWDKVFQMIKQWENEIKETILVEIYI